MKKQTAMSRLLWGIGAIGFLAFSYWLCRFALFDLHGMKQWPLVLAIFGLVVIVISSAAGARFLSAAAALGYPFGFFFGMTFATPGVDLGGGATSNDWIIWSGVYLACMLTGFIVDIVLKCRRKAE